MSDVATNRLLVVVSIVLTLTLLIIHLLITPLSGSINNLKEDATVITQKAIELELRIQALEIQYKVIDEKLENIQLQLEHISSKLE